jgi:hypothetical protein
MAQYREDFPKGTLVRIPDLPALERFRAEWKYHHPLTLEQLEYAGRKAKVIDIGYYHGGDVIYTLEGIPGLWNEQCLIGR